MSADVELLDGAIPLVRGDEPWEWYAHFWDDPAETVPTDLTGKTVSGEIRWKLGAQAVTVDVVDRTGGVARLSLTAVQTEAMPLGRLSKLYVAINQDTEAIVPVDVIEGRFGVTEPIVPAGDEPVNVINPAPGEIVVLTDLLPVYINNPTALSSLFIRLPLPATAGDRVEVSFRNPVTALQMQAGGGAPIGGIASGYGPGAALILEYVDDTIGWVHWK
jgi:hypothetical protein